MLLVLAGCGAAEMESRSRSVADALEKDLGTKPEVRWNTFNGKLQSVSVTFDATKVANLTIPELESKVQPVVIAKFGEKPGSLVVGVKSR
jgi:hypothetical protein